MPPQKIKQFEFGPLSLYALGFLPPEQQAHWHKALELSGVEFAVYCMSGSAIDQERSKNYVCHVPLVNGKPVFDDHDLGAEVSRAFKEAGVYIQQFTEELN
ncbi:MAG: hypothetical protein GQ535_11145 [Rhodobacteraceae bacterium]|nr:hypothetical protein [Paracoccaceae bacterium]